MSSSYPACPQKRGECLTCCCRAGWQVPVAKTGQKLGKGPVNKDRLLTYRGEGVDSGSQRLLLLLQIRGPVPTTLYKALYVP